MVRQISLHDRIVEPLECICKDFLKYVFFLFFLISYLLDFHKDEVRVPGRELGLPAGLLERLPFPGAGY